MARPPEYVRIRRGIHVVATVGPIKLGVDRVTQERAIIVPTPAGNFPVVIDPDDYLNLGIAIVRDSGTTHDFTEKIEDPEPVIEHVDGRPPEAADADYPDDWIAKVDEMEIREEEISLTESVRAELEHDSGA